MSAVLAQDGNGHIWFKSDWMMSDITGAKSFQVVDESFLWSKWIRLTALVPYNEEVHGTVTNNGRAYKPANYWMTIGWYKTIRDASMAMEHLMPLIGLEEISPMEILRKKQG